jgi:hypothetical protein
MGYSNNMIWASLQQEINCPLNHGRAPTVERFPEAFRVNDGETHGRYVHPPPNLISSEISGRYSYDK